MTSRYDVPVDPAATNNPHSAAIRLVGTGRRVLEVGCAGGHVTRHLADRGNEVVGIELDPTAAEHARQFATAVHVADLDDTLPSSLVDGEFDVVVLGDVLEHLRDPAVVLADAVSVLGPAGRLVVSVPNVAHIDVRMMLLAGEWHYQDVGVLDRTHLRWFTRESLRALLADVGFVAVEVERVTVPFTGSGLPVRLDLASPEIRRLIEADPEAGTFQWVVAAERAEVGEHGVVLSPDDALAATGPVPWPDLGEERRRLEAQVAELSERCEALGNEVDAWRRSRLVRWTAPIRSFAARLRGR